MEPKHLLYLALALRYSYNRNGSPLSPATWTRGKT